MRNGIQAMVAVGALLLALPSAAPAQQDLEDVRITSTHVAGNVYMLQGAGGNIGVSVGEDGILIVDDEFAPLAEKIRTALGELGEGDLQFVLNTHWHGDHTGGNVEFGDEAPIIAHHNVRSRMSSDQVVFGDTIEASPPVALPVITFGRALSIHFNGEEIRAIHLPHGHTDGDAVIYFPESNVVHMGDDFFAGMFPFVDLASGGDVEGLARNVATVLDRIPADAKVIPGHGPLSDVEGLREFGRMLEETIAIVRERRAGGMDLEAIQSEGLPPEWDDWASGFITTDVWLELIYRSLEGDGADADAETGERDLWNPHGH